MDTEIFLCLPDEDLWNACDVDKYTKSICSESFWKARFIRSHGFDLGEYDNRYYYLALKRLSGIINPDMLYIEAAKLGYLNVMIILEGRKVVDLDRQVEYRAGGGVSPVIKIF